MDKELASDVVTVCAIGVIIFALGVVAGIIYRVWLSGRPDPTEDMDEHDPYR